MPYYLLLGMDSPGEDTAKFTWAGSAPNLKRAEQLFHVDCRAYCGLTKAEYDTARAEGEGASIVHAYVSDTPIRIA